jgi:hypothetical protein
MLPERIKKVRFRGDSAAYQYELMDFFQQEVCQRFGRIEFAISCDVSESFKRSVSEVEEGDWKTILVTNMDWEGEELIHWSRKRCGHSEQFHSVMKGELCGGKLPSGKFGANACW